MLPWLCGGDFNLMLMACEKVGGEFKDHEADIFRKAVASCGLLDLGFIGHEFTLTNNKGGADNIQDCSDRFLANNAWKMLFPRSFVSHLTKRKSGHLPLLLCIKAMWLREDTSTKVVQEAWQNGANNLRRVANKLSG
ncbi:Somatolactin [Bienertia sinuspersici]